MEIGLKIAGLADAHRRVPESPVAYDFGERLNSVRMQSFLLEVES